MAQKVTLYGIEAELPPGRSVARLNERGEPYLCQPSGDPIVYCYTAGPLEIFAATVIMRWDDVLFGAADDTELTCKSEAQLEAWRAIREASIKEQKT
jgi:hypothetical protein